LISGSGRADDELLGDTPITRVKREGLLRRKGPFGTEALFEVELSLGFRAVLPLGYSAVPLLGFCVVPQLGVDVELPVSSGTGWGNVWPIYFLSDQSRTR
jgi:hypothetical protein